MKPFSELSNREQKNFYDLGAEQHGAKWWQSGGRIKREIAEHIYTQSMHNEPWRDCSKWLPYRDHIGKLRLPWRTQYRTVLGHLEYREREETYEEWHNRQF